MGMVEDVLIRFAVAGANSLRAVSNQLRTINTQLTQTGQNVTNFGNKLSGLGTRMSVGLSVPIIAGFTKSVMAASDFEESLNVVDVTFQKNAQNIKKWSKTLLYGFGVGEDQAIEFSGTMGSILKSVGFGDKAIAGMSKTIVELTGDFASFKNLKIEESFTKIRSGLLGETEPLKQVGILVDETTTKNFAMANGLKKKWKQVSQAEKVMWRYKSILSQTNDSQGDFKRTIDSLANQIKILQGEFKLLTREIGTILMPYALKIVAGFRQVISIFKQLRPGMKRIVILVGAIVAIAGPLLVLIGGIIGIIGMAISGFGALAGALAVVIKPAIIVIAVIAALVAILGHAVATKSKFNDKLTSTQKKISIVAKTVMIVVNVFKILISVIMLIGKILWNQINFWFELWIGFMSMLFKSLHLVVTAIGDAFKWMGDTIFNVFEGIKYKILQAVDFIVGGVINRISQMAEGLNALPFVDIGPISYSPLATKAPEYRDTSNNFTKTKWRLAELKGMFETTVDTLGDRIANTVDDVMTEIGNIAEAGAKINEIWNDDDFGVGMLEGLEKLKNTGKDISKDFTNFMPTTDDIVKDLGNTGTETGKKLKGAFDDLGKSIQEAIDKLFDLDKAFYKITFERFSPGKLLRRTRQALRYTTETVTGIEQLRGMGVNQNILKYLQDKGIQGLGIIRGLLGADVSTRQSILSNIGASQTVAAAGVGAWQRREIHLSGGLEVKMGNETIKLSKEAVEKIVASVIVDNATRYI